VKQRKWTAEEKVAIVLESLEVQKEGQKSVENGKYLKIRTTNGGISSQMRSKALNSRSSTEARHEENREIAEDNRLEVIQIEMLKKTEEVLGR